MSKELWIEEVERLVDEMMDDDMGEPEARAIAERDAHWSMWDRLNDAAEHQRDREREGLS